MKDFVIVTDSTCDLNHELEKELDIYVLPLNFTIDNITYLNYLDGREINLNDFYKKMEEGHTPKTSQLNQTFISDNFKKILDMNKDILYICFSSGLSGTFNAARLAKEELQEDYPDSKILIVDSLCASAGEGLLVYMAAKKKMAGATLDEVYKYTEDLKLRVKHSFTVLDVDYLKRGGRLKATAAFVAKALNIKPVLYVNDEGKLIALTKKHGRRAAINTILTNAIEGISLKEEFITIVSGAACMEDCLYCKNWLEEKYKELNVNSKVVITDIGPVIGSHSGPGTLAIFTIGDKR
ncbi:MAG: DegV family protein [Acholeplasmatales bacterium]|nr:DegV family protein [Acholeplasmatales bacterium]